MRFQILWVREFLLSSNVSVFFLRLDNCSPSRKHRSEIPSLPAPTLQDPEEIRAAKNAKSEMPTCLKETSYRQVDLTT